MSLDPFDDLLGDSAPIRPSIAPAWEDDEDEVTLKTGQLHKVLPGVSVAWLAKVFGMMRPQVERKLARCPAVATHENGAQKYDLKVAAAYLVPPVIDLKGYLRSLKREDIPEQLRDSFWSARLKEQKWRIQAGELWPTESVVTVLGDTFKTIKQTVQLWTDTIEEQIGVSDEQRVLIRELGDKLLTDIHMALIEQSSKSATLSQLEEIENDDAEDA